MNRISVTLWGDTPRYCVGAVENVKLLKRLLPGWEYVVWVGKDVPIQTLESLEREGAKLHREDSVCPILRRYLTYDFPGTEYVLFRDTDVRLCEREVALVKHWMASGRQWHHIRDHVSHINSKWPILGKLLGAWKKPDDKLSFKQLIKDFGPHDLEYGLDHEFLKKYVLPIAIKDRYLYEDFYAKPFHLGQCMTKDGNTVEWRYPIWNGVDERVQLALSKKDGKKFVLALQYWEGDRKQAEELARMIAAIEPARRDDVVFLFYGRFDSHPITDHTKGFVRTKFQTMFAKSQTAVTGWPDGCNAQWRDLMRWAYNTDGDNTLPIDAILCFEPDCLPLEPNWVNKLWWEWKKYNAMKPHYVVGHLEPYPPIHYNGNGIFHPHLLLFEPSLDILPPKKSSWDTYFGPTIVPCGQNTNLISAHYHSTNVTVEGLLKPGVVFDHGIKDRSGIQVVKTKFGLPLNL